MLPRHVNELTQAHGYGTQILKKLNLARFCHLKSEKPGILVLERFDSSMAVQTGMNLAGARN